MFNTVAGKRIAVFGCAFKADTGDTRESPALAVCRELLEERASVVITDPYALTRAAGSGQCRRTGDVRAGSCVAARGAHAIALVTEWPQFTELDYQAIYRSMVKPAFIFDGRNILDHRRLFDIGFNVYAIGKPPLTHFTPGGVGTRA